MRNCCQLRNKVKYDNVSKSRDGHCNCSGTVVQLYVGNAVATTAAGHDLEREEAPPPW